MTTEAAPKSTRRRNILIGAAVLLFGCFALFAMMGGDDDTPPAAEAPAAEEPASSGDADAPAAAEPTAEPEPTEEPEAPAAGVGVEVPVGDDRVWIVDTVTDLGQTVASGNEFISDLQTTGRFIRVDARIRAVGTENVSISAPKVADSQGREFEHSSDALMILGDSVCLLDDVNPGLEKACSWIYELPADAAGLNLLAEGALFDSPVPISLGQ